MRISAQIGGGVRGPPAAARSGRMRSNAAAKMTRVEERNTVPAQPKNHMLIASITTNWRRRLEVVKTARRAGYGQMLSGGATAVYPQRKFQYAAVALRRKSQVIVLLTRRKKITPSTVVAMRAQAIPARFLLKSSAPLTSPQSVAPRFG